MFLSPKLVYGMSSLSPACTAGRKATEVPPSQGTTASLTYVYWEASCQWSTGGSQYGYVWSRKYLTMTAFGYIYILDWLYMEYNSGEQNRHHVLHTKTELVNNTACKWLVASDSDRGHSSFPVLLGSSTRSPELPVAAFPRHMHFERFAQHTEGWFPWRTWGMLWTNNNMSVDGLALQVLL